MKLKIWAWAGMIGFVALPQVQAASVPEAAHVVTSGKASIEAIPDIAKLTIEVSVSAKDATQAKKRVDDRIVQYSDFLKKSGIERKDINTANLSTQPEYDYLKTGESVLKGYRATRQVGVTLRQLDKLNELLDGALKSGLNEIRSVELGVATPDLYREQARQKAMENATKQASSLAQGFNAKLGQIYSISYDVADNQPIRVARLFEASTPAQGGDVAQTYEQQAIYFDDHVDVVFELQRNNAQ